MDIRINDLDLDRVRETLELNLPGKGYVCVNDVPNVIWATKDLELKRAINSSLLSLPDGMPLVWYCRLVGRKNAERMNGSRLLAHFLETTGGRYRHFLLGDTPERIQAVMDKARKANPVISIEGYSPPFRKTFNEQDDRTTLEIINRADPDLIWVCFGGVKQEKWMHKNIQGLKRGIFIGVGAAFRFYIGELVTPPKAIQAMGMQWIWRTIQEYPTAARRGRRKWDGMAERFTFLKYFYRELRIERKKLKSGNHSFTYTD